MNIYPRAVAQPETALSPVTTSAPTMTAQRDSSWQATLLQSFDAISLSEMDHVALFSRTDTKYVLSEEQLSQALARLTDHYRILEIDGRRLHRYRTLYFDTPDLTLYRQHHNGWRNRYKVRERAYADSELAFLEIKHKVAGNTTVKSRMQTQALNLQIAQDAKPFLRTCYPYQLEELGARLLNTFQRITLVSTHRVERLTVDVGLCFLWNDVHTSLTGVAVAEVKQDGRSTNSEFARQMRTWGVRATNFSKYCIGVSMLYPQVKHNNFKPTLRLIDTLMRGDDYVQ
ncbi:MAG: polyphosphate polymerase domain-containing protein [Anaerolineae bacterium]|nr:polyphosphate polymerase domain-containing protein [Anaerolineae bacterium]